MYNLISANLNLIKTNKPDFIKWCSLNELTHFLLPVLDRSGYIKPPYNFSVCERNKLPNLNDPVINFFDCVDKRIEHIYNLHKHNNKKLVLAYSGGIDSTTILAGLVKHIPMNILKDILIVAASPESILENSELYDKYILSNFELASAHNIIDSKYNILLGDPGTGNFRGDYKLKNFNKIKHYVIQKSSKYYGLNLTSFEEYNWWFFFNYKWQTIDPRWVFRSKPLPKEFWFNQFVVFFNTPYFQSWSIHEGRHQKSVKDIQKQYIQDVFKLYHLEKKGKYFSASRLFRGQAIHDAITSDYQPVKIDDWELYYNPNNSYIDFV